MKKQSKPVNNTLVQIAKKLGIDVSKLRKDKAYRVRLIKKTLPYVLFFFIGDKLGLFYRLSNSKDAIGKAMDSLNSLANLLSWPLLSLNIKDLKFGLITAIGLYLGIFLMKLNRKNFRNGEEYGSAKLGTEKDIEGFINRDNPDFNLILTNTEFMSLEPRMPDPLYNRNKNVLIVGGSGSGKTRFYAKPNIMQLACSIVVTDPKGLVFRGQSKGYYASSVFYLVL